MMPRMDAPRVVFILSTNYAGSHLLAQLLAAHSRCAGVGELHNYRKFRARGSRSGDVVDDYADHPAFAGLDELPVRQWHAHIMERLRRERPGLTHLIDNSKRPDWTARFPRRASFAVHLIRDPRALVSRWMRTYATAQEVAGQRRRVLRRRPWAFVSLHDAVDVYVHKWLIANRRISRLLHSRPGRVVTYRDLTAQPARALADLMPAFGLDFEPRQLRYGDAGAALGTRKRDYLDESAHSTIRMDLRWRADLGEQEQRRVAEHPGVQRYLRGQGLVMTDDGLRAEDPA